MTTGVIICLVGAAYACLRDPAAEAEAAAVLGEDKGIEAVLARDTVFGTLGAPREELSVRSHGSLRERAIPIYACGPGPLTVRPRSNPEVAEWLFTGQIR